MADGAAGGGVGSVSTAFWILCAVPVFFSGFWLGYFLGYKDAMVWATNRLDLTQGKNREQ